MLIGHFVNLCLFLFCPLRFLKVITGYQNFQTGKHSNHHCDFTKEENNKMSNCLINIHDTQI